MVNRGRRRSLTDRAAGYLATETETGRGIAGIVAELRRRRVPSHRSNLFGVVTIACIVVLFVTGLFLMFFYSASSEPVVYRGSYAPLDGVTMSKALRSILGISFDVRGGLLVRQLHHWAALMLPAALILQLMSAYFTGAFRRPRRLGWVLLFGILVVALVGGWSGYALPDDMLAGTGLRIVEGIVLGIPVVGTWLSALLFGGEFPGQIIEHLYPIHVIVVPVILLALVVMKVRAAYRVGPAQFPGPGRTEGNVVGIPILPNAAARAGGLLLIVMGLLTVLAAMVTIAPVWLYGPSSPGDASAGSQPDWYTGFLDGALRLVPRGWEFVWLGHTWTLAVLVPLGVVTAFLLTILVYPFVEEWITGDRREHNLLDRPRNTPTRTGLGVGGLIFFFGLWGTGSTDLVATHFRVGLETVVLFYQLLVIVGPIVAFVVTRRVCLALQRKDRELLVHGVETGRIVRLPGGEYIEVHRPVDAYERWRLTNTSDYRPLDIRPDERGRLTIATRVRGALSRFFFEDRIAAPPAIPAPVSPR